MDITSAMIAVIVALFLYIVGARAYKFYVFYQRINKIPGPEFKIPFYSVLAKQKTLSKEERLEWFIETRKRYKDGYMRLWTGPAASVHIHKPEHVEVLFRSNDQITKPHVYKYMEPWLGQGLLTSTGSQWFHSRKLITPAFHSSILDEFTGVMIEKVAILNKCLERAIKIHGDKPFDIFNLVVKCVLDTICETAMGVDVHAQEQANSEYINAVHKIGFGLTYRMIRPWLEPDWIYFRVSAGKEFMKAVEISHEQCSRVIKMKQEERKLSYSRDNKPEENLGSNLLSKRKRKAFLDLLMEANEKEDNPMSMKDLVDQTSTFMFTGHDSTGALVGWTLFSLGNELDVQKKVHEELDEVLGDSDDQTTLKKLPNLKYLDRVIKETLRLYPSVPNISRLLTKDMQIGDYTVPEGATVNLHIYHLHRDPSVWPDPLRFDPDRFLPENVEGRHPYAYVPFSAGPRNCIGKKYAVVEAKVILAQVLRRFSFKSVESHSTIKRYNGMILRPTDGIYVHMTKRSSKES